MGMKEAQLAEMCNNSLSSWSVNEEKELIILRDDSDTVIVIKVRMIYHSDMKARPDSIIAVLKNYYYQIDKDNFKNRNSTCKKGCTDCCTGDFPISITEFFMILNHLNIKCGKEFIEKYANMASVSVPEDPCIFINDTNGACDIYEVRPLICRKYGLYEKRTGCYKMDHETELLDKDYITVDNTVYFKHPDYPEKKIMFPPQTLIYWFSDLENGELSSEKLDKLFDASFNKPASEFIRLLLA